MADLEKTLKGLNCCKNSYPKDCTHCPYEKDCTHHETCDILIRNAISVIAEQMAELEKYRSFIGKANERVKALIEKTDIGN